MRVEPVTHDMPTRGLWMRQEIGFRTRGSTRGYQDFAGDDIAADNKGADAMADVLKFAPLDFARCQVQSCMPTFQGLDPSQLVRTHRLFSLLRQLGSLLVHHAERSYGFLPLLIHRRSQPIADQMRLEVPFLVVVHMRMVIRSRL